MLRFLDRELQSTPSARVQAHLSTCQSCRQTFAEWVRLYDQLDTFAVREVPEDFPSRVKTRVFTAHAEPAPASRYWIPTAAAAACLIALVSWAGFRIGESYSASRADVIQAALSAPIEPDF